MKYDPWGQLDNWEINPIIRILARETARKLGPREQEGTCQPERPLYVWSRTLKATTTQSMKLSHRNSSLREREPKDWKDWHSKVWVRRQSTTDQQPKSGNIGMWEKRKSSSHVKNHGEQEKENSSGPINMCENTDRTMLQDDHKCHPVIPMMQPSKVDAECSAKNADWKTTSNKPTLEW